MMVTWILEKDVFSEACFGRMVAHFKENSIPYHVVKVIPFIHEIDGKIPEVVGPVVVYGSIGCQTIAGKYGWIPGVWKSDLMDEDKVINVFGEDALNYGSVRIKMTEVLDWATTNDKELFFIKPATDTKEFAGTLMELSEFSKWYQSMIDIGYLTNNDFDVMVGDPKHIGTEWRLVVVNDQIASYSQYRNFQQKMERYDISDRALTFAKDMIQKYRPADVYVIDIVEVEDGFKVIEYNTFNSAGLYASNVGHIIDAINNFIK